MEEKIYQRIKESFEKQNFLQYIHANLDSAKEGEVIISCEGTEELTQQQGLLHGGVVTTIADVTCGYTALTVIPEDHEVLSVEFKINLLRAVTGKNIYAVGKVLKTGRQLVITEAEVYNQEDKKLVAKMLATMIPAKKH